MTVVITGGNAGLGLEAARSVLRTNPAVNVLLACRDLQKARTAAATLDPVRVAFVHCDLASLASVREAAEEIAARTGADLTPLKAVVCNAGLQGPGPLRRSVDGYELTWAVNHLAHVALVRRLLPCIQAPGRIVFVASGTHDPEERTGMPAPKLETAYLMALAPAHASSPLVWGATRYTTSKLCNVLAAYELDRRLKREGPKGLTVNAFDPGFMSATGLIREAPAPLRLALRTAGPVLAALTPRVSTPRRSGAMLARLAVDPSFEGVSGRYFTPAGEKRSSAESYDEIKAARLWDDSVTLIEGRPLAAAA